MAGHVFCSVSMSLDGFIAPESVPAEDFFAPAKQDDPQVQRWMAGGPGAGPRGADAAGDPPDLRSPGAVTVPARSGGGQASSVRPDGRRLTISTSPLNTITRVAASSPFQVFDCHMENHSPPIAMNPAPNSSSTISSP